MASSGALGLCAPRFARTTVTDCRAQPPGVGCYRLGPALRLRWFPRQSLPSLQILNGLRAMTWKGNEARR